MSFSFRTRYWHATDCGGYGGDHDAGLTSCCLSAIGGGWWHQVCSTWRIASQNEYCVTLKYSESDTKALGSVCSFIGLAVLWCHTVIILRRDSSSQTRLSSIDPTYGKRAVGGLSPFRTTGAQRGASADVKEKTDFHSNYSRCKLHIRVNR